VLPGVSIDIHRPLPVWVGWGLQISRVDRRELDPGDPDILREEICERIRMKTMEMNMAYIDFFVSSASLSANQRAMENDEVVYADLHARAAWIEFPDDRRHDETDDRSHDHH